MNVNSDHEDDASFAQTGGINSFDRPLFPSQLTALTSSTQSSFPLDSYPKQQLFYHFPTPSRTRTLQRTQTSSLSTPATMPPGSSNPPGPKCAHQNAHKWARQEQDQKCEGSDCKLPNAPVYKCSCKGTETLCRECMIKEGYPEMKIVKKQRNTGWGENLKTSGKK